MGWLWGSNESSDGDPLRNLDPELREFLDKESPVKYRPSVPSPQIGEAPATRSARHPEELNSQNQDRLPSESLFQDGRYAHLWATYTSQREVEAMCKSDQEKLMDVLAGYKSRKNSIAKVASENCSNEQAELEDCFRKGSYGELFFLCRKQKKAHIRCYEMQTVCFMVIARVAGYSPYW